jgi:uncharacterized protein (DUF2147 family)
MRFAILIPVLAALWPLQTAAVDSVEGFWLTENRKAIVQTRLCGTGVCGHMVWMADPVDAAGKAKLGADGAPLCGAQLIGELKERGDGRWSGGWVMDPRSGDRYRATLAMLSPEKIKLRGYLVMPFLGSSQVWTRVPDDRGGC